jgi:hypothetical protein
MSSQNEIALHTLLRSVRDAIDQYLRVVDVSVHTAAAPAPAAAAAGGAAAPSAGAASAASAASPSSGSTAFEAVKKQILASMIEKTGYPEEMLDLDLDLEADLGIDTVKQVAVYAAAREKLGIALDPEFKLRDHNTLRKVITAMAKRAPVGK